MSNSKATGVAYLDPEFSTCYATEELGYASAAQGTVTQATSKSTGVTLNKSAGVITMNNAALGATTSVNFALTNSTISANDTVILTLANSGATPGSYTAIVSALTTGSATITVRNITGGSLSEAIVLNFCIIHQQ
jgi:N-acetylmuramic acid 6-phosphate (MurNAc-6-P) etherase